MSVALRRTFAAIAQDQKNRERANAPLDMHLHLTMEIMMQRSTSY